MARNALSISEALKVLEELPSDSEFENVESSDTEVYAAELSDNSDVTNENNDEEEVDDPSQPGPSAQPHVPTWIHKKKVRKTLPDFTSRSGPSDELWELPEKTPLEVLLTMFTIELMELIVFETNLYATQSSKPFSPLSNGVIYFYGHKDDAQLS